MKNSVKLFGIIALVAVIGFSFAACKTDEDDGGDDGVKVFTLTGIPAEYNGKYAFCNATPISTDGLYIYGYQSSTTGYGGISTLTLSPISNGNVSLPLWEIYPNSQQKYRGNHTCSSVQITIYKIVH